MTIYEVADSGGVDPATLSPMSNVYGLVRCDDCGWLWTLARIDGSSHVAANYRLNGGQGGHVRCSRCAQRQEAS